jgi:hypothetical protein
MVVDDQLRDPVAQSATVGILLCPDKNDVVVEYAVRGKGRAGCYSRSPGTFEGPKRPMKPHRRFNIPIERNDRRV